MSIPSEQIPNLGAPQRQVRRRDRSAAVSLPTPCIGQGSSRGPATGPSNITVTTERRRALRACAMLYGLLAALCLIWGQLRQLPDERVLDLGSATGQLEIGQEGQ